MAEVTEKDLFQRVDLSHTADREKIASPSLNFLQDSWRRLTKNKGAVFSLVIVIAIILLAILAPVIAPFDPLEQNAQFANLPARIPGLFSGLRNGIDVYVISASMQELIEVFATDKSYGYNLDEDKIYAMRLKISADDVLIDEFNEDYAFTQKEGKSETIERFIRDKYEGKGPILVGGDALGDESMLTKFKDTEVLLIMKREGKLDNLVNDERALIQHRNLQTGLLDPKN